MSEAAANIDATACDVPWHCRQFETSPLAMLAWDCSSKALIAINTSAREQFHLAPEQWQKIVGNHV